MNDTTVNGFITLFRGRGDCYGSWEGGCVKQPLTTPLFRTHLEHGPHIGVYPCVTVNGVARCVWGCSDIDYPEPEDAYSLHEALRQIGITSWLERTRKGWHVWVFATELVPAEDMRNMFLAAHQVVGVPPKEVNPKQTHLGNGVGNYVRLPYPGGIDERRVVDTGATGSPVPLPLDDFISRALAERATPDEIAEVAAYYTPPPPPKIDLRSTSGDVQMAASMLTPLGKVIYREGPLAGRDRSTTITHLAYECFKAGIAPSDALLVLEEADWRWGKFMKRGPRGEQEIEKLVQRVYGSIPSS